MKQSKYVLAPCCVSFTQSDTAKRTPASRVRVSAEFWRGLQEFRQVRFLLTVLLTVYALFLHNSLMPKHREWWLGAELNRRHKDFQSSALPTELPSQWLRTHIQLGLRPLGKTEFQQVTLKVLRWEERDKHLVIKEAQMVA